MASRNWGNGKVFIILLGVVTQQFCGVHGSPTRLAAVPTQESENLPSPAVLVTPFGLSLPVLDTSQLVCPLDRLIDQYSLSHAQLCIARLLQEKDLSLYAGISSALDGNMKELVSSQCDTFRQLQSCASRVFTFIAECIGNGEEFIKMLYTQVDYVCKADYNVTEGMNLAIELRQGFQCLSAQKEPLKECIMSKSNGEAKVSEDFQAELRQLSLRGVEQFSLVPGLITKNEKICTSLVAIDRCLSENFVDKCATSTPEYALTSLYLKMGQALQCDVSRFSRGRPHLAEMLASKSTVRMMNRMVHNLSD